MAGGDRQRVLCFAKQDSERRVMGVAAVYAGGTSRKPSAPSSPYSQTLGSAHAD